MLSLFSTEEPQVNRTGQIQQKRPNAHPQDMLLLPGAPAPQPHTGSLSLLACTCAHVCVRVYACVPVCVCTCVEGVGTGGRQRPSPVEGLVTWQSSCTLLFTGQAAAVGQEKVYSQSSTALRNMGLEF